MRAGHLGTGSLHELGPPSWAATRSDHRAAVRAYLVSVVPGIEIREDADVGLARDVAGLLDLGCRYSWINSSIILDGTCMRASMVTVGNPKARAW